MTYIITLTQKQFITLYNHVLDHYLGQLPLPKILWIFEEGAWDSAKIQDTH